MASHLPAITPSRLYLTVAHSLALALTIFRLIHRGRMHRLWWDDFWAASSLVFDMMYFATIWIPIDHADHAPLGVTVIAAVYQAKSFLVILTVWQARISVACSIIRILPPRSPMRRFTTGVAIFFGLILIWLFIEKFWACGYRWRPGHLCRQGMKPYVGISQLSSDIVSDVLLTGLPILTLWRTKIDHSQRILIFSIFAASIAITGFSIAQNVSIMRHNLYLVLITAQLEAATSLIVCNLLVVVTYFYRLLRHGKELETTMVTPDASARPPLTGTTTDVSATPAPAALLTEISGIHIFDTTTNTTSTGTGVWGRTDLAQSSPDIYASSPT